VQLSRHHIFVSCLWGHAFVLRYDGQTEAEGILKLFCYSTPETIVTSNKRYSYRLGVAPFFNA
jgi:hypothetical protein